MRKIINVVKRNKAIGAGRRKKRNKNKLEEGEVAEKTIGEKRENEHFFKSEKKTMGGKRKMIRPRIGEEGIN